MENPEGIDTIIVGAVKPPKKMTSNLAFPERNYTHTASIGQHCQNILWWSTGQDTDKAMILNEAPLIDEGCLKDYGYLHAILENIKR